ncbi:MAG: VWA domain-containing protein [Gemmatimonadota bacterium]|nr:VWA domain-containing protein [Gemmatimonadota bacterium]
MSFTIRTDRSLIRAGARSTRHVLVRVSAPEANARATRLPVNVALVLDRSGSMSDERKFTLAREAVEQALRMLRPEDRFSLVVYDTDIDVLTRSTSATPDAKRRALAALSEIGPRGGTDLGGGWLRGCEQVADHVRDEAVSRCLLLTDGLANHGITDRDELAMHAAELRRRGVVTSTFGVGADFDERLLRDMAHEGGGNFYFIEGASQIPTLLTGELGEALQVTMRNAVVELTLPEGAEARPLNRFRHHLTPSGGELRVELGDLAAEQEMSVVVRVEFPRGEPGRSQTASVRLSGSSPIEMMWTYAGHDENDRQPRDLEVDREVAALHAALARAEATEANRAGDYQRAQRLLESTAQRIGSYAGNDSQLADIAGGLRESVPQFCAAPMPASAMKRALFAAETVTKSRGLGGLMRKKK